MLKYDAYLYELLMVFFNFKCYPEEILIETNAFTFVFIKVTFSYILW